MTKKMEKLPKCRICLVENVRMHVVVDKTMQILYEKLTDIVFVTEDSRPMLACFFCYAQLKQCCQLQQKCLKAEELFAQMMNEPNFAINQGQQFYNGLMKTPIENISIVDVCQIETIAIKEEFPAVCESLDDIIEPKEEHQSVDLQLENEGNDYSNVEDAPHCSESEFLTEVEGEQEVRKKIRRERATAAKKPKLEKRRSKTEGLIAEEHKKNEHIRTHTGVKPYMCNICQRSFVYKKNLTIHIRAHTGEKPYKCDICQRGFSDMAYIKYHMRTHTGEKPYKCDICQRGFNDKAYIKYHMRTHTGEKPYKCDTCQHRYTSKSRLTRHISTHTGVKPYKCNICQRSFSQTQNLKIHIRTHTGEKPYKCDICQRGFGNQSALVNHMRTHTGEKPYMCDTCQCRYISKDHLRKHIQTHTGVKQYKCDICQRSFRNQSILVNHMRTHT